MLTLHAMGRFRLLDESGIDFSPRTQKARGLIALLALAPGLSRGRQWLQAKLWSDRGSDQAAASLRQALSDIRRQFGPHVASLQSDRYSVALDPSSFRICFDMPGVSSEASSDAELFEDLDIHDPRFKDWICAARHVKADPARSTASPTIPALKRGRRKLVSMTGDDGGSRVARQLIGDFFTLISKAIRAQVDAVSFCVAFDRNEADSDNDADDVITVRALARNRADACFSATLADARTGCVFWAENIQPADDAKATSSLIHAVASRATVAVVDALMREDRPAEGHDLAVRLFNSGRLLSMTLDRDNLARADRQFAAAFDIAPRGGPLAWRALIRQISHFQHMTCDFLPRQEERSDSFVARALAGFPSDPMVQCVGAHSEYLFGGSTRQAMQLARRSLQGNPLNAFAWAALSNLQTAISDYRSGYDSACRAVELSAGTSAAFFFEFYACIAASGLGDYELAMRHAATSARQSPYFAPPRRYLVALNLSTHDGSGFRRALGGMRRIEPSFETKVLLDSAYPVNTLRRIPLIANVEDHTRRGTNHVREIH